MMNNNPYKIDYLKSTIIVSKKFLKAASVCDSKEYNTMIQLRKDFPTFTFEEKQITQKKGKQSYKNLTFEKMREHIILCQDGNRLKQFDYLMTFYETHRNRYAKIKSWYLEQYKDEYNADTDTNNDDTPPAPAVEQPASAALPMPC